MLLWPPQNKNGVLRRSVHKILKIFKNSNFTAVHLPDTGWRYTRLPYQTHRKVYIHCRHTHVRLHYFKTLQTQMVANFLFKNMSNYLTSCWAWPWHWMTFFVRLSEIHREKKFWVRSLYLTPTQSIGLCVRGALQSPWVELGAGLCWSRSCYLTEQLCWVTFKVTHGNLLKTGLTFCVFIHRISSSRHLVFVQLIKNNVRNYWCTMSWDHIKLKIGQICCSV